jgi:hypothetical protein
MPICSECAQSVVEIFSPLKLFVEVSGGHHRQVIGVFVGMCAF